MFQLLFANLFESELDKTKPDACNPPSPGGILFFISQQSYISCIQSLFWFSQLEAPLAFPLPWLSLCDYLHLLTCSVIIQRPHCRIFVALTCTKSHQFQCCGWQGRLSFLSHPLKCQGTELPALSDCTQSQLHQPAANLGLICSQELIPVLLQCTTKVLSSLANLLQLVFLQCVWSSL